MTHRRKTALVDGYNVLHKVPQWARLLDHDKEAARRALLRYCAEWKGRHGDIGEVTVVFDGKSHVEGGVGGHGAGVRAVFTKTGEEADHRIIAYLKREVAHGWLVVSDDAEVRTRSRHLRASVMGVSEFCAAQKKERQHAFPAGSGSKTGLSLSEEEEITERLKRHYGIK